MADDDLHQFFTDLLNRFDRSMQSVDRRLDAQTAVLVEMRHEVRSNTGAIEDMRDGIRANTQAVLHVLDELRGRGPAPA